jgi:hypothetical protein
VQLDSQNVQCTLSPCAASGRVVALRPAQCLLIDVGVGLRMRCFPCCTLPFVVVQAMHAAIRHGTSNMAVVEPLDLHKLSQAGRIALYCRLATSSPLSTLVYNRLQCF